MIICDLEKIGELGIFDGINEIIATTENERGAPNAAPLGLIKNGDALSVRLVKPGEEPDQGVGYLDDGTMVVVENGRGQIGQTVRVHVTSTLQTSAGRLVFAKLASAA